MTAPAKSGGISRGTKVCIALLALGGIVLAYRAAGAKGASPSEPDRDVLAGACVSGATGPTACGGDLYDRLLDWLTGDAGVRYDDDRLIDL